MNAIPLQNLTDDEFTQLVKMHAAHLSTLVKALQEHQLVNRYLQEEAKRRALAAAAVPAQVDKALRNILDNSR